MSPSLLDVFLDNWHQQLRDWSGTGALACAAREALRLSSEPELLRERMTHWRVGDFQDLPRVVTLPASAMGATRGAYVLSTDTIVLNSSWLARASQEQVIAVLTEELGHHLDRWIHDNDTPGDEGELFAALLMGGGTLNAEQRQRLRTENDHGHLGLSGQARAVEQSTVTATITHVRDNVGLIQGPVAVEGSTNDRTPTLSGSLSAPLASGESVSIFNNGTILLGSATVSGNSWMFTPSLPPSAGTRHSFTARVVGIGGGLGPASPSRVLVVDTTAPTTTAAITAVTDNVGLVQGTVAPGGLTDDTTPTLSGTLSAPLARGDSLRVFNGTTPLGSATVNSIARTWSYTPASPLTAGSFSFSVAVADGAGNLGTASAAHPLTIDRTPPILTIGSSAMSLKAGETATLSFFFSEDPGSSFSWNGTSGDVSVSGGTLSALSGSGLTRTATFTPNPDSSGTAVITVPDGSYADAAGNPGRGSSPLTLTIDTSPASPPPLRLYDASLPALPSLQGWLAFGTAVAGGQVPSPNGTILDSRAFLGDGAGYSNWTLTGGTLVNSAFPSLDRSRGFSLELQLRLIDEVHSTSNRAGFSLTLLDQGPTPRGIEIGFWSNSIFSQAGGATPFQSLAQVVNGVDTRQTTTYSLFIQDQSYTLLANNRPLLSGPLQDYSQAPPNPLLPFNPYTRPNFLFLGDNTTSAAARVELGTIALGLPLSGSAGPDAFTGTASPDRFNGGDGHDTINGGGGADWLIGGSGSDQLAGGDGDDLLSGGTGTDQFLFGGSAPFRASALGVDSIVGFNRFEDRLLLARSTFTALPTSSSLPSGAFALVGLDDDAASSQALIVYNTQNGSMLYNPNGSAPGFATTPEEGGKFLQLVASSTGSPFPSLDSGMVQII